MRKIDRGEFSVKLVRDWSIDELIGLLLDLTLGERAPGVTKSFLAKAIMTFSDDKIADMLDKWKTYQVQRTDVEERDPEVLALMDAKTSIREGVIVHILKLKLLGEDELVTKKYMQCIIYFAQVLGVELRYKFKMGISGPRCRDLANDLDVLDVLRILDVDYVRDTFNSSVILKDQKFEPYPVAKAYIEEHKDAFDRLTALFHGHSVAEMNTLAVVHFVSCVLRERGSSYGKEDVVRVAATLVKGQGVAEAYDYLVAEAVLQ